MTESPRTSALPRALTSCPRGRGDHLASKTRCLPSSPSFHFDCFNHRGFLNSLDPPPQTQRKRPGISSPLTPCPRLTRAASPGRRSPPARPSPPSPAAPRRPSWTSTTSSSWCVGRAQRTPHNTCNAHLHFRVLRTQWEGFDSRKVTQGGE